MLSNYDAIYRSKQNYYAMFEGIGFQLVGDILLEEVKVDKLQFGSMAQIWKNVRNTVMNLTERYSKKLETTVNGQQISLDGVLLQLEVTNACNHKCMFCPNVESHRPKNDRL